MDEHAAVHQRGSGLRQVLCRLFTRAYLKCLRERMGRAVRDLAPFDEAYDAVDWSRYRSMPAFDEANRVNACKQYLRLEREDGN